MSFSYNNYEHPAVSKHTLWMGELEPWMDENYLQQLYWSMGQKVGVRLHIDKSGMSYAFIDFPTYEGANQLLQSVNGTLIPNTNKYFRLNWSTRDVNPMVNNFQNPINGYCIFVGDLGQDVNDNLLLQSFAKYRSVRSAKVVLDPATGYSRGFGFVKFLDEVDQLRSIEEMQGAYVGSSRIMVSIARDRSKADIRVVPESEITTVFVGCLNNTITEDELYAFFGTCGKILAIKMVSNKNLAFIQYEQRYAADKALAELNGAHLGGAKLRLSMSRTQLNIGTSYYNPPAPNPHVVYPVATPIPAPKPLQQPPPPIDLVNPIRNLPTRIQNDTFLSIQEKNAFDWFYQASNNSQITHSLS